MLVKFILIFSKIYVSFFQSIVTFLMTFIKRHFVTLIWSCRWQIMELNMVNYIPELKNIFGIYYDNQINIKYQIF